MTRDHHLEGLDVFRGATIAAMILVNNPGDWSAVFPPLMHTDWNGWSAADTIYPFFVFIMGCAMSLAFARRDVAAGPWRPSVRIVRRAVTLVVLGLALNLEAAWPHIGTMRIPGVLQRLGLAYLLAGFIVRSCGAVGQSLIAIALLLGHWGLLTLVPFGGTAAAAVSHAHNLAGYVDTRVFGRHTLTPGFDPEGLLGTGPTVATALLGALAGHWLRRHADRRRQIVGLVVGGAAAIVTGLTWSTVWPINKPLWSGSYALLMSGLAAVTLAASLWVVDRRAAGSWLRPFSWLGGNPLAIYFGAELVAQLLERPLPLRMFGGEAPKDWLYWRAFAPLGGDAHADWASLFYAATFAACWLGVAALLHRRGVHIRI